nr:MAG TPA: hypothetical protein [Caudoviricetes sp.]
MAQSLNVEIIKRSPPKSKIAVSRFDRTPLFKFTLQVAHAWCRGVWWCRYEVRN